MILNLYLKFNIIKHIYLLCLCNYTAYEYLFNFIIIIVYIVHNFKFSFKLFNIIYQLI